MDIHEAIKHATEMTKLACLSVECQKEHSQLAAWLTELIEKRKQVAELERVLTEINKATGHGRDATVILANKVAHKDRVIEVLAWWASKYLGEGDEYVAIEKAEAKAKELAQ